MLVLNRKRGESIAIGDNIRIVIVAINQFQVHVGIDAPRELRVSRLDRVDEARP